MRERFTQGTTGKTAPEKSDEPSTSVYIWTIIFIVLWVFNFLYFAWIMFYRLYYGPHVDMVPYIIFGVIFFILLLGAIAAPILLSTNIVLQSINTVSGGSLKGWLTSLHDLVNKWKTFGTL